MTHSHQNPNQIWQVGDNVKKGQKQLPHIRQYKSGKVALAGKGRKKKDLLVPLGTKVQSNIADTMKLLAESEGTTVSELIRRMIDKQMNVIDSINNLSERVSSRDKTIREEGILYALSREGKREQLQILEKRKKEREAWYKKHREYI